MNARANFCWSLLLTVATVLPAVSQTGGATASRSKPTVKSNRFPRPVGTHLAIKARNYGDSIVLRWSVDQGAYWLAANERGYILERFTYLPGKKLPLQKRLTVAPIKPWSLDSMKKRLGREDRYAAIVAQILHGKTFVQPRKGTAVDFYQLYQQQQGQLLVAAMAAEFSPGAASALGLRWVDRSFNKSALRCVYRLRISNGPKPGGNDLTDTVSVAVLPGRVDTLSAPRTARVDAGDGALKLVWYKFHNSGSFSGYYIERSADNKTFRRLNEVPFVPASPDSAVAKRTPQLNTSEVKIGRAHV